MSGLILADPKKEFVQQIAPLKQYASRVVLHGESLAPSEEGDRATRMQQFLAIGGIFHLTQREMVGLLLSRLFHQKYERGFRSGARQRA